MLEGFISEQFRASQKQTLQMPEASELRAGHVAKVLISSYRELLQIPGIVTDHLETLVIQLWGMQV